jgi:hypothetical protein
MAYTKIGTGVRADKFSPHWNGEGQKCYSMVALTSAVAKVSMAYVPTDSGMGCYAMGGANYFRICIPLETVASGNYVECVVDGIVKGVSVGSSGKVSATGMSAFVKGDYVFMGDTGVYNAGGATWTHACWTHQTTNAVTTAACAAGIALSSGTTPTFDLWLLEKSYGIVVAAT